MGSRSLISHVAGLNPPDETPQGHSYGFTMGNHEAFQVRHLEMKQRLFASSKNGQTIPIRQAATGTTPSHDPSIEFTRSISDTSPSLFTFQSNDILFHGLGWLFQPHFRKEKLALGGKPPSLARRLNEPGPVFC